MVTATNDENKLSTPLSYVLLIDLLIMSVRASTGPTPVPAFLTPSLPATILSPDTA